MNTGSSKPSCRKKNLIFCSYRVFETFPQVGLSLKNKTMETSYFDLHLCFTNKFSTLSKTKDTHPFPSEMILILQGTFSKLLMIDHAESVLGKRWRTAPLLIITFQYPFLSCSSRFSLSLWLILSHIVVTRAMPCAHWSALDPANLVKLRSSCPVIRLSLILCVYMIPDSEAFLQRFHSSSTHRRTPEPRTLLKAIYQSSQESSHQCYAWHLRGRHLGFRWEQGGIQISHGSTPDRRWYLCMSTEDLLSRALLVVQWECRWSI